MNRFIDLMFAAAITACVVFLVMLAIFIALVISGTC